MGQCWPPVDGRMPFKVAHALENMKFWSVTFLLCGVCLHPLLLGDWVFCMVTGLQASRSVDSQNMFEVGMVKVLAPVVNLD